MNHTTAALLLGIFGIVGFFLVAAVAMEYNGVIP
jgi:hypothetical protein